MDTKAHQICCAHLLRDLNKDKCEWAKDFKTLLQKAIQLKKELINADYYYANVKRQALFDKLNQLLLYPIEE